MNIDSQLFCHIHLKRYYNPITWVRCRFTHLCRLLPVVLPLIFHILEVLRHTYVSRFTPLFSMIWNGGGAKQQRTQMMIKLMVLFLRDIFSANKFLITKRWKPGFVAWCWNFAITGALTTPSPQPIRIFILFTSLTIAINISAECLAQLFMNLNCIRIKLWTKFNINLHECPWHIWMNYHYPNILREFFYLQSHVVNIPTLSRSERKCARWSLCPFQLHRSDIASLCYCGLDNPNYWI